MTFYDPMHLKQNAVGLDPKAKTLSNLQGIINASASGFRVRGIPCFKQKQKRGHHPLCTRQRVSKCGSCSIPQETGVTGGNRSQNEVEFLSPAHPVHILNPALGVDLKNHLHPRNILENVAHRCHEILPYRAAFFFD